MQNSKLFNNMLMPRPRGRPRKRGYYFPPPRHNVPVNSSSKLITSDNEAVEVATHDHLSFRAVKERCGNVSEILNLELSSPSREASRKRFRMPRTAETFEMRTKRLEDLRQRASQRIANETIEQYEKRLEDLRYRASRRIQLESKEQREKRLADLRYRASQRRANESKEQCEQRLKDLRQRANQRMAGRIPQPIEIIENATACFSAYNLTKLK